MKTISILSFLALAFLLGTTLGQQKQQEVCVKGGGCCQKMCSKQSSEMMMCTCEYSPRYDCYNAAKCEVQADGQCGWTQDT